LIKGQGGPREDNIPIAASNGEFIVNARSTSEFLPLLNAINDANGGATREVHDRIRSLTAGMNVEPASAPVQGIKALPVEASERARALTGQAPGRLVPNTVINVTNHYPQAEPTSKTINRSLAFASALDGTT
jgi:hypothetical protein